MDSKFNLKDILYKHKKWLNDEPDGVRANLTGADLSRADLSGADLSGANLSWANLTGANLTGADLTGADLTGADLSGADLSGANLSWADLSWANLTGANLTGADLTGANLTGADLSRAKIEESIKIKFYPLVCPEYGSFIGWKKAYNLTGERVIVKLQIMEDSKRSSAYGRKCRCNKVKVLELQNLNGNTSDIPYAISSRDISFEYVPGEIVSVDNFDENRWNECSTGIHFFITRQEAVDYVI